MSKINQATVREGEWNEAVCFSNPDYPLTEIAAQKSKATGKDYWYIYYVSSKSVFSFNGAYITKEDAVKQAKLYAEEILVKAYPKRYLMSKYGKRHGVFF